MHTMANSPLVFTFSEEDKALVRAEALRRQRINELKGLKGRNGGPEDGDKALRAHMLGAAGELAVASYLGLKDHLFKEAEAKRGSDDLPGIDVKTRSKSRYDLVVQKHENPSKKFVLVTIENRQTLLHGWCYGREAMNERYWADPARGRPAYFVPQSVLHPMEALL
jgi:hypothetical protein